MFKEFNKEIEYCTYCPKLCRFACPAANADYHETSTPWGRQTLLHLIRSGKQELTRELGMAFYQCAYCLICREFCDHEIEVPRVMQAAREEVVKSNLAPKEVVQFLSFFSEKNNPVGDDLGKRVRAVVPDRYLNPDAQVVYWAGCSALYHFPENVTDTIKIFEALDVNYVSVYDGALQCCGEPLDVLGLTEQYRDLAARNYKALKKYKQIISGCPACVYFLRVKYPELGFKLTDKIYHISEFLAPLLAKGRAPVRNLYSQKLIYHDPCYLGRHLGVYDQPRDILREVCYEPVEEFSWNRNHSYCCCGGGGLQSTKPNLAKNIVNRRLKEYFEGEDKVLVTACPSCQRSFARADDRVRVLDIVNVVAKVLG